MKKNKGNSVPMLSPENYIRKNSRSLPIFECLLNRDWEELGLANVLVSRKHSNGNITTCFYLADIKCLGVKDTFYKFNLSMIDYSDLKNAITSQLDLLEVEYVTAHNIIYAALEFAAEYGFLAHKDFRLTTKFFLEEDDENIELIEIACGDENGNPVYVQGPHENPAKVNNILSQLEKTAGSGNYSFVSASEIGYDDFDYEEDD